jgi:hypothetical protein
MGWRHSLVFDSCLSFVRSALGRTSNGGVRRRVDRDIILEDKGDGGCSTGRPVDLEGLAQDGWDVGVCEVCFVRRTQYLDCLGVAGYFRVCIVDEYDRVGVQGIATICKATAGSPRVGTGVGNFA